MESSDAMGSLRVAMLIDGDNAQPSLVEKMLTETGKYGVVTIRRIYGDWTTANMNGWKETLHIHAIQPMQQFRYTTGKNATDSAMIIEAMDILHSDEVNGFCLVSSDSDYTRLATRIREKGIFVMGIGKQTTPKSFVNACDLFVFTENLLPEGTAPAGSGRRKSPTSAAVSAPDPLPILKSAIDISVQDDGWANLATVGNRLRQIDPSFDSRTYGHRQLAHLIRAFPEVFETRGERTAAGYSVIYIRQKE